MKSINLRSRVISFVVCVLCLLSAAVSGGASAQDKRKDFDPAMSLEETVAWLGKQLNHSWTENSDTVGVTRRLSTRGVKAKGCTLSYLSVTQTEGYTTAAADPFVNETRELWAVDLSGLDPWRVNPMARGRVFFGAANTDRDVISTSVFRALNSQPVHLTARRNRRSGYFMVDEKQTAQVAEALRHAVVLCRERRK